VSASTSRTSPPAAAASKARLKNYSGSLVVTSGAPGLGVLPMEVVDVR
jgi:hypothetical protein